MRDTHDRPQRLRLAFAFVGLIFGVSHLLRIVIENALDILETFWRSLCPARSYLGHCEDGRTTRQGVGVNPTLLTKIPVLTFVVSSAQPSTGQGY